MVGKNLLQMAWKFISPKAPDSQSLMNKAQEIGKNENSPVAVMSMIEAWAKQKGKGGILESNQIWQSFKNRTPDDIIPHGEKILKQSGKANFVMDLIKGGNKKN